MSRLPRFDGYRYVGIRDTMRLYDCDEGDQFEELSRRVGEEDLVTRKMIQVFAPDDETEAMNRGFRPHTN